MGRNDTVNILGICLIAMLVVVLIAFTIILLGYFITLLPKGVGNVPYVAVLIICFVLLMLIISFIILAVIELWEMRSI